MGQRMQAWPRRIRTSLFIQKQSEWNVRCLLVLITVILAQCNQTLWLLTLMLFPLHTNLQQLQDIDYVCAPWSTTTSSVTKRLDHWHNDQMNTFFLWWYHYSYINGHMKQGTGYFGWSNFFLVGPSIWVFREKEKVKHLVLCPQTYYV